MNVECMKEKNNLVIAHSVVICIYRVMKCYDFLSP